MAGVSRHLTRPQSPCDPTLHVEISHALETATKNRRVEQRGLLGKERVFECHSQQVDTPRQRERREQRLPDRESATQQEKQHLFALHIGQSGRRHATRVDQEPRRA